MLAVACVQDEGPAVIDPTTSVDVDNEASTTTTTVEGTTTDGATPDPNTSATTAPAVRAPQLGVLVSVERSADQSSAILFDPTSGQISELSDNARRSQFSPDLTFFAHIAVVDGDHELRVSSVDQAESRILLEGLVLGEFVWSPDSRSIVSTVVDDAAESSALLRVELEAGTVEPVTPDAATPLMERSPVFDRRGRLAFGDERNVIVVDPETGDRQRFDVGVSPEGLTWAPDGSAIAFVGVDRDQHADLWVLDVDAGETRRLTGTGVQTPGPRWSPTGALLAFTGTVGESGDAALFVVDPAGSDFARRLTPLDGPLFPPVWSPDGVLIAYRDGDAGELLLIDPARAEPQPTGILGTPTDWR